MSERLLIVGAGGHGKVVADAARAAGWPEIAFVDDHYPMLAQTASWPVLCAVDELLSDPPACRAVVIAIGHNQARFGLQQRLRDAGFTIATIIHPSAIISPDTQIGAGSVVLARAVINIDARIGEACIINTGAIIEHDCQLGNGVHVSPVAALAGGVRIGDYSWIGIGSAVRQRIRIGNEVVVGAGAVVVNDIADQATVVGSPARDMEKH